MGRFSLASAMLLAVLSSAQGQTTRPAAREFVKAGKAATALVELARGRGMATAFCIEPSGVFVTNYHVVRAVGSGESIRLVLNPGELSEKLVNATVLRFDEKADLGVLKVEGAGPFVALPLGDSEDLLETMEVTSFGYPFGKMLTAKGESYPSVTVCTGRITSLRKVSGTLDMIQTDASLNPGCSGGPVLNAEGKVIGIVRSGLVGGGGSLNFAIPVSKLSTLLDRPEMSFTAPRLTDKDRGKPVPVAVKVVSFLPSGPALTLEMSVSVDKERKTFPLKKEGEMYTGQVTFLPPEPKTVELDLTARYARGSVQGVVQDEKITVAGKSVRLKDVALIEPGPPMKVTFRDGKMVEGAVGGLDGIKVAVGDQKLSLELGKAGSIQIAAPNEINSVQYTISARKAQAVLQELSGTIWVQRAPAGEMAGKATIGPTQVAGTKERILEGKIADAVIGGSGRYLILWLAEARKLAIFDVRAGDVVKYLPMDSSQICFAAGADKLLVAQTDGKVLQRYRLDGQFERDMTATLERVPLAMAMGSCSRGPALAAFGRAGDSDSGSLILMDPGTLKPVGPVNAGQFRLEDQPSIRASSDGTVFGLWRYSSSGVATVVVHDDGKTEFFFQQDSAGAIVPGPDGRVIYTSRGVCRSDLTDFARSGTSSMAHQIPAMQGELCLNVSVRRQTSGSTSSGGRMRLYIATIAICRANDSQALLTLPPIETTAPYTSSSSSSYRSSTRGLTLDKRYHYIPEARAIVAIPETNDRVVVREFDLLASLKKSGQDYLFVSSIPVRSAVKGAAYTYPIVVESNRGGMKFAVESGPKGMSISENGRLTWDVPKDLEASLVTVNVRILDASGKETFHTFTIRLKPPTK